jgi:hypothetical protein
MVGKAISEINSAALKMEAADSYKMLVPTYLKATTLHYIPEDHCLNACTSY